MEKELTKGELQVIRLMANGFSSRRIARITKLTEPSVETYRQRIYKKLNAKNGFHCIALCFKKGILTV